MIPYRGPVGIRKALEKNFFSYNCYKAYINGFSPGSNTIEKATLVMYDFSDFLKKSDFAKSCFFRSKRYRPYINGFSPRAKYALEGDIGYVWFL